MRHRTLAISAFLATLTACTGGADNTAPSPGDTPTGLQCPGRCIDPSAPYNVRLTALDVIGGSWESGTGSGEVDVDSDSSEIRGSVSFEGVEPDAVSLHLGFAGERGPLLVWLDRGAGNSGWSFPPSTILTASQIEALGQGGLYLEATTAGSTAPALRGQIIRSGAIEVRFEQFSGSQVVPAVDTPGTALGAITIYSQVSASGLIGKRSMVIHVNGAGLDNIVAAHAHAAMAGANGPVLAELVQDPDDPSHWSSAVPLELGGDLLDAFDNLALYVDIHTATHLDGEVRAQIVRWSNPLFLSLDGGDVVPAVHTSHRGIVAMTTTDYVGWYYTPAISMHVNLSGIDDATAVTLNQGALGQNGEPAISLEQSPDDPSRWSVNAVLDFGNEAYWYVNVLTPAFPNGELRAQIASSSSWILRNDLFAVTAVDPADGATRRTFPPVITVRFNRVLQPDSAGVDSIQLLASGGDASFKDDNEIAMLPVAVTSSGATLTVDLSGLPSEDDVYQLSIHRRSDAPLTDTAGELLESDFISTFAVDSNHGSPPTFQQIQETLLTPACAKSGCHSGSRAPFGLDLSAGVAFDNIVDVPSAEEPQSKLIEPGDPASSYLLSKLTAPAQRSQHTPGEPALSNAMIQKLREWIAAGASND